MHNVYYSAVLPLILLLLCPLTVQSDSIETSIEGIGTIKMYMEKFIPQNHTIENCGDYTCIIDGELFFGTDGKIPNKKITKMVFVHKDFVTELETSGMYDPAINKDNIKSRIRAAHYWGDFYKVVAQLSDGAGTYVAQWIVTKNCSMRTHISNMESAQDLCGEIFGKK